MAEHNGERMREIIEALMSEHVTFETYERWREEASREVGDAQEVRQIITRRTLLCLAQRTTGELSDAMRSVARQLGE